ncbi:zinc finger, ring-type containing protein [Diplocarpon rosae]|nr:zinc finger, ring-type containing protein [Diplocarpon rosae]
MSYHLFRYHAADSPADPSPHGSLNHRHSNLNSRENINYSPFNIFSVIRHRVHPSPWNSSSTVSNNHDSLTLPPINLDNNHDQLLYFDALSHNSHPSLFIPAMPASTPYTNSRLQASQNEEQSRPSNQGPASPPFFRYSLAGSEYPDLFDSIYFDANLPLPDNMPAHTTQSTQQSSFVDLTTDSSPVVQHTMAPSRKRKADTPEEGRVSKTVKNSTPRNSSQISAAGGKKEQVESVEMVDLSGVETKAEAEETMAQQQAEVIRKQNQEDAMRPVKLSEFQCIICMDSPTDLTVTYCGHLFCSECLHQALYAGDKKCCPVCRSNISAPKAGTTKQPRNGVFTLEMKLMTARRKGKQPMR